MMDWGVVQQGWRKGPWTPEEDKLLSEYVKLHGEGRWTSVARGSGNERESIIFSSEKKKKIFLLSVYLFDKD